MCILAFVIFGDLFFWFGSIEVSPVDHASLLCSSVGQVGVDANSKSVHIILATGLKDALLREEPLVRDFVGYTDLFWFIGLTQICNAPFVCINLWRSSACIHVPFTILVILGFHCGL
ncbi:hypothetical protein AMTRI_Chr08g167240 [Amborella trichopoda]